MRKSFQLMQKGSPAMGDPFCMKGARREFLLFDDLRYAEKALDPVRR